MRWKNENEQEMMRIFHNKHDHVPADPNVTKFEKGICTKIAKKLKSMSAGLYNATKFTDVELIWLGIAHVLRVLEKTLQKLKNNLLLEVSNNSIF